MRRTYEGSKKLTGLSENTGAANSNANKQSRERGVSFSAKLFQRRAAWFLLECLTM